MLRLRILSIIVLAPLVVTLIVLGGTAWLATVLVVGVLAGREFCLLLERAGYRPHLLLTLLCIVLFIGEGFRPAAGALRPLLALGLLSTLAWAMSQKRETAVADWALTLAGATYIGGLLAHFVLLRERPDGLWWLLLGMVAVWIGDGGAFLIGLTLGRHKLWPRLSPKKTWEGSVGGFVFTILGVAGFVAACRRWVPGVSVAEMGWAQALLLGALLGPLALGGDLVVSMFKRRAQVKDSAHLIPGHGGMLDRIDSLLSTIPLVYYWVLFVA